MFRQRLNVYFPPRNQLGGRLVDVGMDMPNQKTKTKAKGRKRRRPSHGGPHTLLNDQASYLSTGQRQHLKPLTCNLCSLPFELYSLIITYLKAEKVKGIMKSNSSRAES